MKVRRNTLLLIAALVWSAAGFNILRIGLLAYPPYRTVVNYLLSALVFTVFQVFIFGQLVNKHTARISAYEEELHFFLKFFDVKSFIIMAVMMTGGIWLRSSGVAPDRFISFFYSGLGTSLLLAGLLFACNFAKAALAAKGKASYPKYGPHGAVLGSPSQNCSFLWARWLHSGQTAVSTYKKAVFVCGFGTDTP